jgi:hypothetical protein
MKELPVLDDFSIEKPSLGSTRQQLVVLEVIFFVLMALLNWGLLIFFNWQGLFEDNWVNCLLCLPVYTCCVFLATFILKNLFVLVPILLVKLFILSRKKEKWAHWLQLGNISFLNCINILQPLLLVLICTY